jgi:integrating conjugative element protein (TIGR03761 family)
MTSSKEDARKRLMQMFSGQDAATDAPIGTALLPVSSMADARTGQLGALRGDVKITIQTRQAQLLLTGREPTPERPNRVMGLMQFSKYLGQIAAAAKEDDPWADWTMALVEEKLEAAQAFIEKQQANVQRTLGSNPLLDIQVAESLAPMRVSIGFASSHAYWVARVITEYDTLVRMVLTARHTSLIDQEMANVLLNDAAKVIRRVFESTARYRQTYVSRADVAAGTELARKAAEIMGDVPDGILDKSRRAKFSPSGVASSPQAGQQMVRTAPADGDVLIAEGTA